MRAASQDDAILQKREAEIAEREERLWRRMEDLIDRESELRARELALHDRREAALTENVREAIHALAAAAASAPHATAGLGTPPHRPQPPHSTHLGSQEHASAATPPPDAAKVAAAQVAMAAGSASPTASKAAGDVERIVAALNAGADPLADMDLSMPRRGMQGRGQSATTRSAPPGAAGQGVNGASGGSGGPAAGASLAAESPQAPGTPAVSTPRGPDCVATSGAAETGAGSAVAAGTSEDGGAVETQKAPPDAPPPKLAVGDDDIYWVSALHRALLAQGCYCGDDDEGDYVFGPGTESAVLTFQAIAGLPESGVACAATWAALGHAHCEQVDVASGARDARVGDVVETGQLTLPQRGAGDAGNGALAGETAEEGKVAGKKAEEWPILREGDGSRAVHSMQVKLREAGFHVDEDDDALWWQFGPSTLSALTTFQACAGLPESGVCDGATWRALLGPGATPADIGAVWSGGSDDEDLEAAGEGRVYLLGEHRWARF